MPDGRLHAGKVMPQSAPSSAPRTCTVHNTTGATATSALDNQHAHEPAPSPHPAPLPTPPHTPCSPQRHTGRTAALSVTAVWTRPTPDRDENWTRPSYVPNSPVYQPPLREEPRPLYSPAPEFKPAEQPDREREMPSGPKMPERRPDPIPAGNPKEKPPAGNPDKREAPPPKEKESAPKQ